MRTATFKTKSTTWRTPFGIVNHLGNPWSTHVFWDREAATAYLKQQKAANPTWQLGRHRIVPVSITIRTVKA